MAGVGINMGAVAADPDNNIFAAVYVKATWAEPWNHNRYIMAVNATFNVAPSMSEATFKFNYGMIVREAATAFQQEHYNKKFINWYFQIRVLGPAGEVPVWTGIIARQELDIEGNQKGNPSGVQTLIGLGLEHLLDRQLLHGAHAEEYDGGSVVNIGWMPRFNKSQGFDSRIIGNRSETAVGTNDTYVFGRGAQKWNPTKWGPEYGGWEKDEETRAWTNLQIIKYLLEYHQADGGPEFTLTGWTDDLDKIVTVTNLEGMSLKRALDVLIPRQRGLGWYVLPADKNKISIVVFTGSKDNISFNDTIYLHGNGRQKDFVVDDNIYFNPVVSRRSYETLYHKIIGQGARIKSCFTVSFEDDTLEDGWTADEETAYKTACYDDHRKKRDHERVYSFFRVPVDWDWQAGDGEAGEKHNAAPTCKDDGTLDMETVAPFYNADRAFLRRLPFKILTEKDDAEPTLRRPLVFMQDPKEGDAYYQVDEPLRDNVKFTPRMSDREMGIYCKSSPNHLFALFHFFEHEYSPRTKFKPEYDYETIVATVFAETDERLKVVADIERKDVTDKTQELVLRDHTAELWFVTPHTVIDAEDGELIHYEEKYKVDDTTTYEAEDYILRDDSERLRTVVALAKAWYEQPRGGASISVDKLEFAGLLGYILTDIKSGSSVEEINAPITQVSWDFQCGRSSITTGYVELDFQGMLSSMAGVDAGNSAPAKTQIERWENDVSEIREHIGGLPTRFEQTPHVLISDDKHREDGVPDHNSVITRQSDGQRGSMFSKIIPRARPGEDIGMLDHLKKIQTTTDPEKDTYALMWHVNDATMGPGKFPV